MRYQDIIEQAITGATGHVFSFDREQHVGGGSINTAMRIHGLVDDEPISYFIKFNRASLLTMFEAEADGLVEMAEAEAIRVPSVICSGIAADQAFLVLEYLPFGGSGGAASLLGRQLAGMHRKTASRFGWQRDNTIGLTPQYNNWNNEWFSFWRQQRLGVQLELAAGNGIGRSALDKGQRLMADFPALFSAYRPDASLLHGDLWSGNYSYLDSGEPVIFDPAVYYGDREADLAMTELFGGFPAEFYRAYDDAWPIDAGYKVRKNFYNLYHILNHYNLFGGGYGSQAERMMSQLLAEI